MHRLGDVLDLLLPEVAELEAGPRALGDYESQEAIRSFEEIAASALDQTLWSETRRNDYKASLEIDLGRPMALLLIPSLDLKVPIFDGADDANMNRGVGRIMGSADLGGRGNLGIAGHRDGYFRVLKDIAVGDRIEVRAIDSVTQYRVADFTIVDPEDVEVLDPGEEDSITLVTCHPFYYVGHAPRRFIVRGVVDAGAPEPSKETE